MTTVQKSIGYFGIGVFTFMAITGASSLLEDLLQDLLILVGAHSMLAFLVPLAVYVMVMILLIKGIVNRISKRHPTISDRLVYFFIWSFVLFMIAQLLQLVYPMIKEAFSIESYITNKQSFLKMHYNNPGLYFFQGLVYYIPIVFTFYMIYKRLKTIANDGQN